MSLRDLIKHDFSDRRTAEGAKSIFESAASGQALMLIYVIIFKDLIFEAHENFIYTEEKFKPFPQKR